MTENPSPFKPVPGFEHVRIDSQVRYNLLTQPGYTPYCGGEYSVCGLPRLTWNGKQFGCRCGFTTKFDDEFIEAYRTYRASWQGSPQYCRNHF